MDNPCLVYFLKRPAMIHISKVRDFKSLDTLDNLGWQFLIQDHYSGDTSANVELDKAVDWLILEPKNLIFRLIGLAMAKKVLFQGIFKIMHNHKSYPYVAKINAEWQDRLSIV